MSIDDNTAGLKIVTDTVPPSLIIIILKYRKDSIAKIKQDIEKGNFVLSCSFVGHPEEFTTSSSVITEYLQRFRCRTI